MATKPVLITTEYRGVFAGLIDDSQDLSARSMPLKNARMAMYGSGSGSGSGSGYGYGDGSGDGGQP